MKKSFVLVSVIFSVLLSVSTFSFAGNGGSYSGGDTWGDAFPITTEPGLQQESIDQAMMYCLKELSIDLWNQIHLSNFDMAHANHLRKNFNQISFRKRNSIRLRSQALYQTNLNQKNECNVNVRLEGDSYFVHLSFSRCEHSPLLIFANPEDMNSSGQKEEVTYVVPEGISFFNLLTKEFRIAKEGPVIDSINGTPVSVAVNQALHVQCLRSKMKPL